MRRPELAPARGGSPHADQADATRRGLIGGSRLSARPAKLVLATPGAPVLEGFVGVLDPPLEYFLGEHRVHGLRHI